MENYKKILRFQNSMENYKKILRFQNSKENKSHYSWCKLPITECVIVADTGVAKLLAPTTTNANATIRPMAMNAFWLLFITKSHSVTLIRI